MTNHISLTLPRADLQILLDTLIDMTCIVSATSARHDDIVRLGTILEDALYTEPEPALS